MTFRLPTRVLGGPLLTISLQYTPIATTEYPSVPHYFPPANMVLHNPNNWHWVNKDVSAWTQDYLSKELVGVKAEKNGVSAQVSKILSMDGDVDVSQRKGKVITIFDVRLQLE